jgi:hypothetical protein
MNVVFFPEIWDALRAAAEAELILAQTIVDSAGVIVQSADLTICYDERGPSFPSSPIFPLSFFFFYFSLNFFYSKFPFNQLTEFPLQVQNMNYPSMF